MTKRRVLIIDDDEIFTDLIEQTLVSEFKIKVAKNSWAGMEAIDSFKPDIIVLDILMPAVNGLSLLNEIISHSDLVQIPIIVCSSIADQLNQEALQTTGIKRVVDKTSMHPGDIKRYIKHVLG